MLTAGRASTAPMIRPSSSLATFEKALVAVGLLTTLATYTVLFLDEATIMKLAGDEQAFEMLSALAYGFAAVLCVASARRLRRTRLRVAGRTALIALALLFAVASGEELSWGQHILKFRTPDVLAEANRQDEFNLHNLGIFDSRDPQGGRKSGMGFLLNSNRFLDYFMLSMFVLLPIVIRRRDALGRLAQNFDLPRFGLGFAAPLALNYGLTALSLLITQGKLMSRATSEIRETNSAMLCLLLALYLFTAHASADDTPA
jgi:hypothetical protein